MLLAQVVLSGTFEKRDRNSVITIDSKLEQGGDPLISCDREIVLINESGKRVDTGGTQGEGIYSFRRKLSTILNVSITLPPEAGGFPLTVGQVALAMEMISDLLATEARSVKAPIEEPVVEEPSSSSVGE